MGNLLQLINCGYKLGKEKQIVSGNGSENPAWIRQQWLWGEYLVWFVYSLKQKDNFNSMQDFFNDFSYISGNNCVHFSVSCLK